jgi:hypothetical protein
LVCGAHGICLCRGVARAELCLTRPFVGLVLKIERYRVDEFRRMTWRPDAISEWQRKTAIVSLRLLDARPAGAVGALAVNGFWQSPSAALASHRVRTYLSDHAALQVPSRVWWNFPDSALRRL